MGYRRSGLDTEPGKVALRPGAKQDQGPTASRMPSMRGRMSAPARSGSIAKLIEQEAMVVPTPRDLRGLFDIFTTDVAPQEPTQAQAVEAAYEKCRDITSEYSKTFFLGSQLLGHQEQRAVWAIYNWCRTTDELVDGPAAATTTMADLDAWAGRLDDTFAKSAGPLAQGMEWEDLSLADSIQRFSLIKRPFEDMIAGMAMDLTKDRYSTFQELEVYCYRVAGTVGLMTLPVLGFEGRPELCEESREKTVCAAMSLGMAFQLTNILRDVGEDGRRGRIYVPLEDLRRFHIDEEEILEASCTEGLLYHEDRWRDFMEFQMARCEKYYKEAEEGIMGLREASRLGVMAALNVYQGILNRVRANDYNNFTERAFVTLPEKALLVGKSWWRVQELQWFSEAHTREESRLTSEIFEAMHEDGN